MYYAASGTFHAVSPLLIFFLSILSLGLAYSLKYGYLTRGLSLIRVVLKAVFGKVDSEDNSLQRGIQAVGFAYDPEQDIFYSTIDAWQRNFGYCRLYDEAAAPLSMIIDCEPITFNYDRKKWMIQFWKGQYALTTGCEIGVYTSTRPEISIPGLFQGTFYDCASDEDLLQISYIVKKNGKVLFTREGKHWWLTGFLLFHFSEPWELTMDINITLKDSEMRRAFEQGLIKAGYAKDEIFASGSTVCLEYDEPRTPQPLTRTPATDWIVQRKNALLCRMFKHLTKSTRTAEEKVKFLEKHSHMYGSALHMGRHKDVYKAYETIKEYL